MLKNRNKKLLKSENFLRLLELKLIILMQNDNEKVYFKN